jgi:hypothetical protein
VVSTKCADAECGRQSDEPDDGVRAVVSVLDYVRWVVPYEWFAAFRRRRGGALSPNFIALYAFGWIVVLTALFILVPEVNGCTWVKTIIAIPPVVASIEIVRWWLSVILNRAHYLFLSFERNLLYLVVNLSEIALAGAVLLRLTSKSDGAAEALFAAFFLTLQLSNGPQGPVIHDLAQMFIAGCSLVLLAGGLAILLGGLASSFREGEYEGPWPLPRRGASGVPPSKAH